MRSTAGYFADSVLSEPCWMTRAMQLREELSQYRPYNVIDAYLATAVPLPAGAQHHAGAMVVSREVEALEPAAPIRLSD